MKLIFIILFFASTGVANAQDTLLKWYEPSPLPNQKRTLIIAGVGVTSYAATMIGLNEVWYKGYDRSSFHLFDDNGEWLQMDKTGHVFAAYQLGRVGIDIFRWGGVSDNKSIWIGGSVGSIFLTTIEILDGFSTKWGFSLGDVTANTIGSALCISQALLWNEQRIMIKYSYHPVKYPLDIAQAADNLYGKGAIAKMVKDYNGLGMFVTGNISTFLKKESKFPKWLNIAVGLGAEGMLGGYSNLVVDKSNNVTDYRYVPRYRQYYLSLDIDFTRIKTRSPLLKSVFSVLCGVKVPAPAIEYNRIQGVKFHPIYF